MKASFIILVSILVVGCSSNQFGRRTESRFPNQKEIQTLAQETKTDYFKDKIPGKVVEGWALKGPLPNLIGATVAVPSIPLENLLADALKTKPKRKMTVAMNCVAREIGEFRLANGGDPFGSLRQFIFTRCGGTGQIYTQSWKSNIADSTKAFEKYKDSMKKSFEGYPAVSQGVNSGIAFVTNGEKAEFIIAHERESATIKPSPIMAQGGGLFVVEGRLETGEVPERFYAVFNRGDYEVERCRPQPVKSPAFKFVCQLDQTDSFSYFQIGYKMKDALFSNLVSEFIVFPSTVKDYYEAPKIRQILKDPSEQIEGENQLKIALGMQSKATLEGIAMLINRVRSTAGLPVIISDFEQTKTIQKLAPAFFNSDKDLGKKNKIVMGMLAGWDVNGEVMNARFSSSYLDIENAEQLVEYVLEMPSGRQVLLSKETSAFALGVLGEEGKGLATVFVSYKFLTKEHSNRRISRVMKSLNRARRAQGMSPAKERTTFRADAHDWAKELEDGAAIEDVTNDVQQALIDHTQKGSRAYMFLVADLDDISFTGPLVGKKKLKPIVVVAPYRPLNSPWTFYAVIIVYN